MGAVTALFVRKVLAVAGDRVDQSALLSSVGLGADAGAPVDQMVADVAYYALLEEIAAQLGDATDFPLHVAATMRCDDYGGFGLAWKTAPSLRDSFARAARYWRLLTSVALWDLREDAGDAWFALHREGPRRLGLRLSNEASIASAVTICREVAPKGFTPLEVHFRHKRPVGAAGHDRWFGCPVVFGSDRDAILVSAAALATPNRLGDDALSRYLAAHLDAELATRQNQNVFETQVRAAVADALSAGSPRMAVIAKRMGVSERSLQRRLGEHGLSFQQIVEAARRDLAESLLVNSDYALAEIAFLTGFSEQSAFTRAFRRWADETPAAFRQARRRA